MSRAKLVTLCRHVKRLATPSWQSIMRKVTWRRFNQSAKQLVVGQTTKHMTHSSSCDMEIWRPEVEHVTRGHSLKFWKSVTSFTRVHNTPVQHKILVRYLDDLIHGNGKLLNITWNSLAPALGAPGLCAPCSPHCYAIEYDPKCFPFPYRPPTTTTRFWYPGQVVYPTCCS